MLYRHAHGKMKTRSSASMSGDIKELHCSEAFLTGLSGLSNNFVQATNMVWPYNGNL